jgi:hypothetical protein
MLQFLGEFTVALISGPVNPLIFSRLQSPADAERPLAVSRLPEPQVPPQSQQDILATVLEPIVAFVVLGSTIIRECYDELSH